MIVPAALVTVNVNDCLTVAVIVPAALFTVNEITVYLLL